MTNPYEAYSEKAISAPRKQQLHRAAQRELNKKLQERDKLLHLWTKWHREQQELLAKSYPLHTQQLMELLHDMDLEQGPELVALIRQGPWAKADSDTQFYLLRLIDMTLARLRERHGLAPFDDALEGEEPTAFQQIRDHVFYDGA